MAKPIPRGSSSPGSKGLRGAIKDAVNAAAAAAAPASLRPGRYKQGVEAAVEGARYRYSRNQSTDKDNY